MITELSTVQRKAIDAIHNGNLVDCTSEEYHAGGVRSAIQQQAGKWIDQGQGIRAQIALNEVRRLDEKFPAA